MEDARPRMPVGPVQCPAPDSTWPEPHVPGGSAKASRSSSSPAAARPLPSAARRLLRKDRCQEMSAGSAGSPRRASHPAPPAGGSGDRRAAAHRHQVSTAGAGGSECRPAQSARTHAGSTQREVEMGATSQERCPGLLDLMILEVFSSLNDSTIPWLTTPRASSLGVRKTLWPAQ